MPSTACKGHSMNKNDAGLDRSRSGPREDRRGPHRRDALRHLAALPLVLAAPGLPARPFPAAAFTPHGTREQEQPPWTPLFNGRDLTGWQTFLGNRTSRSRCPR